MPRKIGLTDEQEKEIVALYESGVSKAELSRRFGFSKWKADEIIKKSGIKQRRKTRFLQLNDKAFDDWSDNAQYWAGFLCADGSVRLQQTRRMVALKLSQKDESHLMLFRDFVGSSHQVCRQSENNANKVSIQFCSDPIYDLLKSHGIYGLKPSRNPSDFLANSRHFWRGVFDADGCLTVMDGGYPKMRCLAWHPLIDKFYDFCKKRDLVLRAKIKDTVSISSFHISGTRAAKLCNILYSDCDHCLARKKELAIKAMAYA